MAQQPTIVSGQNIIIPAPQAGDNVTITSSPSGNLTFEFDINSAEPSRVDNDLVLQTPEGSVTIGNFFAVGDESLPTLTLTDGVVVDATDFFDGSGVDMTTAAGPAGARADGSGTSYDDGAGALIDGLDRLGSLGNFHWGRDVEFGGDDLGLLGPTGDFAFSINTEWGGTSIGGVYEDGLPDQHEVRYGSSVPDNQRAAGEITLAFNVGVGTTVGNIVFSGVPSGTFWSGNPASGGVEILPNAGGSYVFTQVQFTSPGVFYLPAENNSDDDINFTISVDFTGPNGATITQSQTGTIIVDAVADLAEIDDFDIATDGHVGGVQGDIKHQSQEFEDGWENTINQTVDADKLEVTIPVQATVTFDDYDPSEGKHGESHYVLIAVPTEPENSSWSCPESTGTIRVYSKGDEVVWDSSRGALPSDINEEDCSVKDFFQIPVDNQVIADSPLGGGKIIIDANLTVKGDAKYIDDITINNVEVIVKSAEENPSGEELTKDNNYAYAPSSDNLALNVVNSTLTIKTGWASEGNNDSKHTSNDYIPTVPEAGATRDGEAPIHISIDKSDETIVGTLTFTIHGGEGSLQWNGSESFTVVTEVDPVTGEISSSHYTLTVPTDPADYQDFANLLAGGGLTYVPNSNSYSDEDVSVDYTITIGNGTGVENTYKGDLTVVVDAVADMSTDVNANIGGSGSLTEYIDGLASGSATPKDRVESNKHDNKGWEQDTHEFEYKDVEFGFNVTVSTTFPDTDGSERHYILVEIPGGKWSLGELPPGYSCDDGSGGRDTIVVNGTNYYRIEVDDNGAANAEVDIPLVFQGALTGDESKNIKTGSYVQENAETLVPGTGVPSPDEYDINNNTAVRTDGGTVSYTMDVINSKLTVKTGWASEGNNDAKHLGAGSGGYRVGSSADAAARGYADSTGNNPDGRTNTGAPITIAISGEAGNNEYIDSITLNDLAPKN